MKKILYSTIVLSFVLTACNNQPRTHIDVEAEHLPVTTRAAGTTFTLVPPFEVASWSSVDESIAVVCNGVVTTKEVGATSIIAVSTCGSIETTLLTVPIGCNLEIPGFGVSLGEVSFASNQEWTIVGNGITQIWSDVVQAQNCRGRTTYHGGHWGSQNFYADCRSNPDQKGDLFTWCAVIRFQDELCPLPWRVPTQQDFIDLDRAFGGNDQNRTDVAIRDRYFTDWGATYSGYCNQNGRLDTQGLWAFYWASTEYAAATASLLALDVNGFVGPRRDSVKYRGFALRCVR